MTKYDTFKVEFFLWLKDCFRENMALVLPSQWATRFQIPVSHVQELLVRWADEKLIWLGAWDGMAERPWNQWPAVRTVFQAGSDGGNVRVRLLADGADLAERLSKQIPQESPAPPKVGFTAS